MPTIEMPKYKSHKEVWALKIKEIAFDIDEAKKEYRESDGSAMITPTEERYGRFKVDATYIRKHQPQIGGYYVVYEDGYKSFSPAKAFEKGYEKKLYSNGKVNAFNKLSKAIKDKLKGRE